MATVVGMIGATIETGLAATGPADGLGSTVPAMIATATRLMQNASRIMPGGDDPCRKPPLSCADSDVRNRVPHSAREVRHMLCPIHPHMPDPIGNSGCPADTYGRRTAKIPSYKTAALPLC